MNEKSIQFTQSETAMCSALLAKDTRLRDFLASNKLDPLTDSKQWLTYLVGIKSALGNLNNDISFVSTLLAKEFLFERFSISDFDAGKKPQGAAGIDIEAVTADGLNIGV